MAIIGIEGEIKSGNSRRFRRLLTQSSIEPTFPSPDETICHSTKLANYTSQVAGYAWERVTETVLFEWEIKLDHQLRAITYKLHRAAYVVEKSDTPPVTLGISGNFTGHMLVIEPVPRVAYPNT